MKPEADVRSVCGKYKIYCEHYKRDRTAKTAIMVNGALTTTISFSQTIEILLHLIEQFGVNYLVSASWGGGSALLSLARRPPTVEKAPFALFPLSSMLHCTTT